MSGVVYYTKIWDYFFSHRGRNALMNFKQAVIRLACLTLARAHSEEWVRVDRNDSRKRT